MGSPIQMIGQVKTILFWEVTHHSENKAHFWVTDNLPQGPEKPAIWAEEREQGPVRMLRADSAQGRVPEHRSTRRAVTATVSQGIKVIWGNVKL